MTLLDIGFFAVRADISCDRLREQVALARRGMSITVTLSTDEVEAYANQFDDLASIARSHHRSLRRDAA